MSDTGIRQRLAAILAADAARLQTQAEPGSIAVSGMVREAVGGRIAASFTDLGEQQFKNISAPVRVFRIAPGAPAAQAAPAARTIVARSPGNATTDKYTKPV